MLANGFLGTDRGCSLDDDCSPVGASCTGFFLKRPKKKRLDVMLRTGKEEGDVLTPRKEEIEVSKGVRRERIFFFFFE